MSEGAALNTVEEVAVNSAVRRMLAGELHRINDLPPALRGIAQARYAEQSEEAARDTLERQRSSPVHTDPIGLH